MSKSKPQDPPELAAHLKLSLATVSLVLNGRARALRISPRTEKRILGAAERFGIKLNRIAASLRSGRTASIGLVVPDIANPFFAALAQQIERGLREGGRVVLLADSAESVELEERSLQELQQRRVDGLIVAPVGKANAVLEALVAKKFPLVCVDRLLPGLAVPQISIDHAGAVRQAIELLVRQGHRKIGCLRGTAGVFSDDERVRGYRKAMKVAGLKGRDEWIAGGDFNRDTAQRESNLLLARGDLTAVVSLAGQVTLGLLETVRERGIRCPAELSIIAFDEQPWCGLLSPPLTTVEQPIVEMARRAVDCLHSQLEGNQGRPPIFLPAKLIERASVAKPMAGSPGRILGTGGN